MKKLAIVALALVIAMSFVGCGISTKIIGDWKEEGSNWYTNLNFSADNTCSYKYYVNDELVSSYNGEWSAEDADTITISGANMYWALTGTWDATVEGDVLTLGLLDVPVYKFTRVK